MANWQLHLKMQPEWSMALEGEITHQELAGTIAKRLKELRDIGSARADRERVEIADDFEALSTDPWSDEDDFDHLMDMLYDWGDMSLDDKWNGRKVCWIDTIGAREPS